MGEKTFQVAFSGDTVPGASLDKVKANVAQLFKAPAAKIEPLFSGKRFVIKKNLDEATARKYQTALKRAGALAEVIDAAGPASEPERASPPKSAAGASPRQAPHAPQSPGAGTLAGATVDEPGVVIVKPEQPEEPDINVSHLSMDRPGATLVEHEEVDPPQVNTAGLSLDEPGVTLIEPQETEPPRVDTSGLSMDEPGATLVEPEDVETPDIDTSSLSLKE